ncbi:TIGR03564 family F420-dependent LLM class oxidoreductase [Actinopolymorpha sp. B17G11]|uniref:TIGR03564 family F420-dependent LLM class oxidoreductase n=1 Tax=Actinopolymorpha sp. B17G11 TaxID=3160861 RepID=UPI0032E42751
MRVGLWIEGQLGAPVEEVVRQVSAAAEAGYARAWIGEVGSWDPLTLLAVVGRHVREIEVGTAIVRTYPRHPLALAAQALTVQAATGNRLVLGLGPSHAPIIENEYGQSFAAPGRNMREYLSALTPLLRGESVAYHGESWTAVGGIGVAGADAPPVLVSALGPVMLRVAGELADGTITAWAGPPTIGDMVRPALERAAAGAGRRSPAVVASVCVCVTADPDGARRWVNETFGRAGELPSYRAVLDREGLAGPGGAVVAGDETAVERGLRRFADAGATEILVIPVGTAQEKTRTVQTLGSLAPSLHAG